VRELVGRRCCCRLLRGDKSAECIEQFLDIIQSFIKVVNLKMIVALPVGCIIMNKLAANGMHADNTRAPTRWAIFSQQKLKSFGADIEAHE
jgi:hypothetical protein